MTVRTLFASFAFFTAIFAAPAFAENTGNANHLARICESARLTDVERRECRAMFKLATDDAGRQAAFAVFHERINGPTEISNQS
jgi:hypothetical protein